MVDGSKCLLMIKFVFSLNLSKTDPRPGLSHFLSRSRPASCCCTCSSVANYRPRHGNIFTFYTGDDSWLANTPCRGCPGTIPSCSPGTCRELKNIFSYVTWLSSLTSHLKQFRWKSLPSARSFFTLVSPFLGTIILPQPPQVEQNFLIFQSQ